MTSKQLDLVYDSIDVVLKFIEEYRKKNILEVSYKELLACSTTLQDIQDELTELEED